MTTSASLVCLVDDRADYRLLVEAIFKRSLPDYSVGSFANGLTFLEALPELVEKPNLVLLDQHMPGLNGYQTLVALKSQSDYQSIPVVIMSGDASGSEVSSFYQAGAATFIRKPIDFTALREALLTACQYASPSMNNRFVSWKNRLT